MFLNILSLERGPLTKGKKGTRSTTENNVWEPAENCRLSKGNPKVHTVNITINQFAGNSQKEIINEAINQSVKQIASIFEKKSMSRPNKVNKGKRGLKIYRYFSFLKYNSLLSSMWEEAVYKVCWSYIF